MPTPKKPLKLLLVDDSTDDRELILMNLRRGGYNPDATAVDTKEDFENALINSEWDLIICDYSMPGFDGLTALSILRERGIDIPFILVSGAIGEELAVRAMKAGANDYLMKDNLQRLVPAIERELKDAKLREKHREAQIERDRLLTVIQNSLNEVYIFDCKTLKFQYLNQAAVNNLGYSPDIIPVMTPIDINPYLDSAEDYKRIIQPLLDGELEKDIYLTKHTRKDGTTYPIEIHLQLIRQNDQQFFTAIGFDLTDREKDARRIKEQKEIARELAEHSKHKSEFLANMSHELRTPLNSILLLSKLLMKSKSSNLSDSQLKYIDVIQQSGENLLSLINEILDLSKIESGEMEISFEEVHLTTLVKGVSDVFEPVASDKNLTYNVSISDDCPANILTDQLRLEQVLRNLLSNAMKFTKAGQVDLHVWRESLNSSDHIFFSVKDTGIGIPREKQNLVFESFRQADGSTQRKFGGTGLGLAICRQIAELLNGELTLESSEGVGSTFTLRLPLHDLPADTTDKRNGPVASATGPKRTAGSEKKVRPDIILISENRNLAGSLGAHANTLSKKMSVVGSSTNILDTLTECKPAAVLIDPYLPGVSGWSLAKKIIANSRAPLPVWMVTDEAHTMPAIDFDGLAGKRSLPLSVSDVELMIRTQQAPLTRSAHETTLLLIDDNKIHNEALSEFAEEIVDNCLVAPSAKKAFEILADTPVDCIVLDLTLPDATGQDVLEKLRKDPDMSTIPVIIYSGRSLNSRQKEELMKHAADVILKNVGSHSKLMERIDELISARTPDVSPQKSTERRQQKESKSVLIVDDDDRSYFSMSSLLENNGYPVCRAVNGREALSMLKDDDQTIGLVLLDLMMPEMDGFETIRRIRHDLNLSTLPVCIVTAKAMKGDREECLKQGATDYISKPVSPEKVEQLLSIWMPV